MTRPTVAGPITINRPNQKGSAFSRKLLFIVVGASMLVAAVYAHIHLAGSQEYTGPLAVLDHIFDLIVALGVTIVVICFGHATGKCFKLNFASVAEDVSFSIFLGTGVMGLSMLGLGLVGLLRPWPIAALLILTAGLTRRCLPELYRMIRSTMRKANLTREAQVLTVLFLTLITLFLLRAWTPPTNGDELIYHLPVTKEFVDQGRIYPSYDNALGNLPFLIHMIYALCLMAGSDIAAKLFSLILAINTALALYAFCSRFLTRRVGTIALFAFFAAGMVVEVAVTTRIDVSLAGMLFVTTYAMMNYLETEQRGWFWVSAMLAGFSLGIKYSAGLWLLLVGIMYLYERLVRKHEHFAKVLKWGMAYTIIAVAIASPWYIKNYVWFQNPVYPFFTGEIADFGSQGIRYFNTDDEGKLDLHFDSAREEIRTAVKAEEEELFHLSRNRISRHPMRFWEFFTEPNHYLMSEPYHFPNYIFLMIPLTIFTRKNKWVIWLLSLSIGFFLTVTWTAWIARYLLPVYPPLSIVSAYGLVSLGDRLGPTRSLFQRLPIYAVSSALLTVVASCALIMLHERAFGFVAGTVSRHEFMFAFPYYRPIDFINRQLPVDARILMVGAQMNYGIQRGYLADESWFSTKWRRLLVRNNSLEEVNQDLKRQGLTHILYRPHLFKYAAIMGVQGTGGMDLMSPNRKALSEEARILGPEYPVLRNWATFTLFQSKFLETIYSDESGYQIFKIK